MWFLMNFFFPFKTTQKQSMEPPTSQVISIFYSWLPQIHTTRTVEPDSQIFTPSTSIPLPNIPSLTFVSNSVIGSFSYTNGQQQLHPASAPDMTQTTTQGTPQTQTVDHAISQEQEEVFDHTFNNPPS
jgi:hypothetical protein